MGSYEPVHERKESMRIWNVVAKGAAAAALTLALASPALAMHHEVKVAKAKDGSSYLTDAKGMALYTFKKDTAGKSACSGDCVTRWPLFQEEKVGVTGDVKASDFKAITREDGKKQATYKGMPLYYFADDKAPGDTKGHNVKEVWFLAKP
jgi:predicted lipoprotein with Yx(FWY)xxD motif